MCKRDNPELHAEIETMYVCMATNTPTTVDDAKLRHLRLEEIEHLASMRNASRTTAQLRIHEARNVDTQEDANDQTSIRARTDTVHVDGYEVTAREAQHTTPTTAPPSRHSGRRSRSLPGG